MKHARPDYDRMQDPAGLIPVDEPVFLIRGQDRVGSKTVRAWAQFNKESGGDPAMTEAAMDHAILMDAWPKKKHADLPRRTLGQMLEDIAVLSVSIPDNPARRRITELIEEAHQRIAELAAD